MESDSLSWCLFSFTHPLPNSEKSQFSQRAPGALRMPDLDKEATGEEMYNDHTRPATPHWPEETKKGAGGRRGSKGPREGAVSNTASISLQALWLSIKGSGNDADELRVRPGWTNSQPL